MPSSATSSGIIETAYINQFNAGFTHAFQQMESKLTPFVETTPQASEYEFYDRLGLADDVVQVTDRYGDSPHMDVPHGKRRSELRDFEWGKLIDEKDLIRVATDPTNEYTTAALAAFARHKDTQIVDAATKAATVGKQGATSSIAYVTTVAGAVTRGDGTTTEGLDIGVNIGGTALINVGKLTAVKKAMMEDESYNPQAKLPFIMGPEQWEDMMGDGTIQNFDTNTSKVLGEGELNAFMGFNYVVSNRLTATGGVRSCFVLGPRGIKLTVGQNLVATLIRRPDKRNVPYIYIRASFDAIRMWGEHVIRVNCND